ncbi:hypothetical protein ES703_22103 [subsurface metagenome]
MFFRRRYKTFDERITEMMKNVQLLEQKKRTLNPQDTPPTPWNFDEEGSSW